MTKSSTNIPSRYWEPEDDRTEEELIQIYESEEHQEIEIPFEYRRNFVFLAHCSSYEGEYAKAIIPAQERQIEIHPYQRVQLKTPESHP